MDGIVNMYRMFVFLLLCDLSFYVSICPISGATLCGTTNPTCQPKGAPSACTPQQQLRKSCPTQPAKVAAAPAAATPATAPAAPATATKTSMTPKSAAGLAAQTSALGGKATVKKNALAAAVKNAAGKSTESSADTSAADAKLKAKLKKNQMVLEHLTKVRKEIELMAAKVKAKKIDELAVEKRVVAEKESVIKERKKLQNVKKQLSSLNGAVRGTLNKGPAKTTQGGEVLRTVVDGTDKGAPTKKPEATKPPTGPAPTPSPSATGVPGKAAPGKR